MKDGISDLVSFWEASHYSACVTASTSMVRMEVVIF